MGTLPPLLCHLRDTVGSACPQAWQVPDWESHTAGWEASGHLPEPVIMAQSQPSQHPQPHCLGTQQHSGVCCGPSRGPQRRQATWQGPCRWCGLQNNGCHLSLVSCLCFVVELSPLGNHRLHRLQESQKGVPERPSCGLARRGQWAEAATSRSCSRGDSPGQVSVLEDTAHRKAMARAVGALATAALLSSIPWGLPLKGLLLSRAAAPPSLRLICLPSWPLPPPWLVAPAGGGASLGWRSLCPTPQVTLDRLKRPWTSLRFLSDG